MPHNPPRYNPARMGPITTVWQAHYSGRTLWAFCRNCGKAKAVDTWRLTRACNGDNPLEEAARRFRCTACQHRATILIPAEGLNHDC